MDLNRYVQTGKGVEMKCSYEKGRNDRDKDKALPR